MTARVRSEAWKKRVARERRRLERQPELAVCWLCGDPIDMGLPVHHQRAFTLDHVVPIARGGAEMGESKPAHRECNSSRSDGRQSKKRQRETLIDW